MSALKGLLTPRARAWLRGAQARVLSALFEPGFPYPTAEWVLPDRLGYTGPDEHRYEPSGFLDVVRMLYRERVTRADVFVDIGCGRGRILHAAARRYPFGRVVGLDLSAEIVEQAQANLAHAARRRPLKCPVEVVRGDARDWPLPDDATHVFHANAVGGEVHRAFLAQVAASFDRNPRRLLLHYAVPGEHELVLGTGRFRPVRTTRGLRDVPARRIVTYRVVPAAARA